MMQDNKNYTFNIKKKSELQTFNMMYKHKNMWFK